MGINEYAMWNYKNGKPWYIQQTEVTMVRGVTEAVPCLLLVDHPTDLRPVILDVTEQVVNSICTFKWLQWVPLLVISVQKQFTAEEVNFSDMIKCL